MIRGGLPIAVLASLGLLLAAAGCSDGGSTVTRVVFVTLDTTRADRLGCYGHAEADTPNLDRLAESGTLFEQAVSPVPTTLPSHSTMFTGLYPQDHGVRYNLVFRLGPEAVTLAEILKANGFETAGFPAAYVLDPSFGLNQEFETYGIADVGLEAAEGDTLHNGRRAGQMVDAALRWLDGRADEEPQFLWVHFYDPHAPYIPPFPYLSNFRDRPYDGELAYVDAQFGRLLERLEASPAWDNTLVIVAGDHGEGLHQHRERFHANLIYESTQRAPLIIRAPGMPPGRVKEPVTLADLTPTVLDLTGLESSVEMRGMSLRVGLEGSEPPRRDIYFESLAGSLNYGWHELRGVRYGRWKLIESANPELYDLETDPGELVNVAGLETQRVANLTEVLDRLGKPSGAVPSAEPANDPVTDPESEAFLASLGYVSGVTGGSAAGAPNPRDLIDLEPELMEGQLSISKRAWPVVEEVCRYVIERNPTNRWALNNLAGALMWTEQFQESQDVAAELVRIYPDEERGYVLLARAYRARERIAEAQQVLQQGLESAGDSPNLRFLSIVAEFELGVENPCLAKVPDAVERYPRSALFLVLEARCEARDGRIDEALETVSRAMELGFTAVARLEEIEDFDELVTTERYAGWVAEIEEKQESKPGPGAGETGYDPSQLKPY